MANEGIFNSDWFERDYLTTFDPDKCVSIESCHWIIALPDWLTDWLTDCVTYVIFRSGWWLGWEEFSCSSYRQSCGSCAIIHVEQVFKYTFCGLPRLLMPLIYIGTVFTLSVHFQSKCTKINLQFHIHHLVQFSLHLYTWYDDFIIIWFIIRFKFNFILSFSIKFILSLILYIIFFILSILFRQNDSTSCFL